VSTFVDQNYVYLMWVYFQDKLFDSHLELSLVGVIKIFIRSVLVVL